MASVPATKTAIAAAASLLRAGRLVAFPTETVYGLGANATDGMAVASIFEAKGRPRFNPLIVHVPTLADAMRLAEFNTHAHELATALWPGPLTLVLPKRTGAPISDLATAGLPTIAIRVPSHPIAQALLSAVAIPVAAPSANRSGHVSATRAEHVEADLGASVAMILDGGACDAGIESTIIDVSGNEPRLLRPGAMTVAEIENVIGRDLVHAAATPPDRPTAPGQLESHYAPAAQLRSYDGTLQPDEALLAFGSQVPPHAGPLFNLSPSGNLKEAAANLFAALRALDTIGARGIVAMPIPQTGLGEAINDRLRRAAAPR